jgi:hypothetical protein
MFDTNSNRLIVVKSSLQLIECYLFSLDFITNR